jgi:hypothetical protein
MRTKASRTACPSAHFTKTKMCKFEIFGVCAKGTECPFAHGKEEMKPLPDLRRTKICKELIQTGTCSTEGCLFAHTKEELRGVATHVSAFKTKLCSFFKDRGYCAVGSKCNFAHYEEELREPGEGTPESSSRNHQQSDAQDQQQTQKPNRRQQQRRQQHAEQEGTPAQQKSPLHPQHVGSSVQKQRPRKEEELQEPGETSSEQTAKKQQQMHAKGQQTLKSKQAQQQRLQQQSQSPGLVDGSDHEAASHGHHPPVHQQSGVASTRQRHKKEVVLRQIPSADSSVKERSSLLDPAAAVHAKTIGPPALFSPPGLETSGCKGNAESCFFSAPSSSSCLGSPRYVSPTSTRGNLFSWDGFMFSPEAAPVAEALASELSLASRSFHDRHLMVDQQDGVLKVQDRVACSLKSSGAKRAAEASCVEPSPSQAFPIWAEMASPRKVEVLPILKTMRPVRTSESTLCSLGELSTPCP